MTKVSYLWILYQSLSELIENIINMKKEEMRLRLFNFTFAHNSSETAANINRTWGEGVLWSTKEIWQSKET